MSRWWLWRVRLQRRWACQRTSGGCWITWAAGLPPLNESPCCCSRTHPIEVPIVLWKSEVLCQSGTLTHIWQLCHVLRGDTDDIDGYLWSF
ncbi:hypothetical protein FKM82_028091 [Ascaphus truei]